MTHVPRQGQGRQSLGALFIDRQLRRVKMGLGRDQIRVMAARMSQQALDGADELGTGQRGEPAGQAQRGLYRQTHAQGQHTERVAQRSRRANLAQTGQRRRRLRLQTVGKGRGASLVLGVGSLEVLLCHGGHLLGGGKAILRRQSIVISLCGTDESALQRRILAGVGGQQHLPRSTQRRLALTEIEQHPTHIQAAGQSFAMAFAGRHWQIIVAGARASPRVADATAQPRQISRPGHAELGRLHLGIGPGLSGLRIVAEDPLDRLVQCHLRRDAIEQARNAPGTRLLEWLARDRSLSAEYVRLGTYLPGPTERQQH
ncbi:hypothetical protein FQZ97_775440 [compost metagenome]